MGLLLRILDQSYIGIFTGGIVLQGGRAGLAQLQNSQEGGNHLAASLIATEQNYNSVTVNVGTSYNNTSRRATDYPFGSFVSEYTPDSNTAWVTIAKLSTG